MKARLFGMFPALLLAAGCSSFVTKQYDDRYENGQLSTSVRTTTKAKTLWDSDSQLANFKAAQTEKSQSAEVGSLNQKSTGSNTVEALKEIRTILGK